MLLFRYNDFDWEFGCCFFSSTRQSLMQTEISLSTIENGKQKSIDKSFESHDRNEWIATTTNVESFPHMRAHEMSKRMMNAPLTTEWSDLFYLFCFYIIDDSNFGQRDAWHKWNFTWLELSMQCTNFEFINNATYTLVSCARTIWTERRPTNHLYSRISMNCTTHVVHVFHSIVNLATNK